MPALTSRKEARERLRKLFEESLARIIPDEESTPLKGQTFRDFEDQVEAVRIDLARRFAMLAQHISLNKDKRLCKSMQRPSSGVLPLRALEKSVELVGSHVPHKPNHPQSGNGVPIRIKFIPRHSVTR